MTDSAPGTGSVEKIWDRLRSGSIWGIPGRLASILASVVGGALIARLLTPHNLGVYYLAMALASIGAGFATLGLDRLVVREVAESMTQGHPGRAAHSIRRVLLLAGLTTSVVCILLALSPGRLFARYVLHASALEGGWALSIVIGLVVLTTFRYLIAGAFQGFHDLRSATVISDLATNVLIMLVLLGLWTAARGGASLNTVLVITLAGAAAPLVAGAAVLARSAPKQSDESPLPVVTMLSAATAMFAAGFMWQLLSRVDLFVLASSRPSQDVAVYGAAEKVSAFLSLPLLLSYSILPSFITALASAGKRRSLERMLRGAATLSIIPTLALGLIFVSFAPEVLGLLFGSYFRRGDTILRVLALGDLGVAYCGYGGLVLVMTGGERLAAKLAAVTSLATVALAIVNVRLFGPIGLAATTAVGTAVQAATFVIAARRREGVWTHAAVSYEPVRHAWRQLRRA